jgi:2-polyprenyl-3-methyl-5-hydroxy-6-metoxy-1,4-benzoquinol methylase
VLLIPTPTYTFDDSPLLRIIDTTKDLHDNEYVLRINGQNCSFHEKHLQAATDILKNKAFPDVIKFPDDFISQLTFDVYRIGALRQLANESPIPNQYHIHPKYYPNFTCEELPRVLHYNENQMLEIRNRLSRNSNDHGVVNENRIPAGDLLSFHYQLALQHLKPGMRILDLACGAGYGTRMLANQAQILDLNSRNSTLSKIVAGDINRNTLENARKENTDLKVEWLELDATRIGLQDSSIDFFTSFETIEHVTDLRKSLAEFARLLSPTGIGFFSTPQNCFGEIPLTWWHEKEFSYEEIYDEISRYFHIDRFIGIKQGRIFFEGDPIGTNSFICVSPK